MKTDRLIETLALDTKKSGMDMSLAWVIALGVATVVAAAVFVFSIGPRPDIAAASMTVPFLFKFLVTIALFGTAWAALVRLGRPGASVRSEMPMLLLAPILLVTAVLLELTQVPASDIKTLVVGTNAKVCMTFIPVIGLGPLVAFVAVLRHGAATAPALSGAIAGLAAGGLAATFYAAHCTDDSPLFVAVWYPLAVLILAIIGAIGARLLARW